MDQLVVLLVIAAISFINWLIKKSAEQRAKKRREAGAPTSRDFLPEFEDEAPARSGPPDDLRKFMEALGLPADAPEPPRPPEFEKRRVETWQPPALEVPVPVAPPPLPKPAVVGYQRPKFTPPTEEARRLARRLEARGGGVKSAEIGGASRFREMLRSRQGMRDAVVLNEILSKPKGLQSF